MPIPPIYSLLPSNDLEVLFNVPPIYLKHHSQLGKDLYLVLAFLSWFFHTNSLSLAQKGIFGFPLNTVCFPVPRWLWFSFLYPSILASSFSGLLSLLPKLSSACTLNYHITVFWYSSLSPLRLPMYVDYLPKSSICVCVCVWKLDIFDYLQASTQISCFSFVGFLWY